MTTNLETGIILIVDDSPTNLEILSSALETAHFTIAVALDGESAIEQVKYKPPDLILLDVMMPGIDGFETCKRLKADPSTHEIPIIFMTALSDPVDKVKGLNAGAVDYITKPFQQEEILARVRVHLKLYNLTRTLEQKVAARTAELTQALQTLQQTQTQLIQQEKLTYLGQIVAGVAAEISNPINFIYGNLAHTDEYIKNLLALLALYQQQNWEDIPEIQALIETIDLAFIQEDLPKSLASMQVGVERIQEMVHSLKNFLRLDESEKKAVNLHEGIDSTLIILSNRLKAKSFRPAIRLVKDYGNLPLVECYAVQMNQVFMDILSQGIDALDAGNYQEKSSSISSLPTLLVRTQVMNKQAVQIKISHNGRPIAPDVQQHLFEPFVLANPKEKRPGTGLFFSYKIVTETHRGQLQCVSSVEQGTEFRIELPLHS